MRLLALSATLICLLRADPLLARGPSTREERARVIRVAGMLQRDPLSPDAPAAGKWVREWATEVPDVRVAVCWELFRPEIDSTYAYDDELKRQMWASAAAFSVRHPERSRDDLALYRAGVEGALRAYEALSRSRSDAGSPFLEDLRAKRDRGELAAAVKELAKRCRRGPDLQLMVFIAGTGTGLLLAFLVGRRFGSGPAAGRERDLVRKATRSERIVLASVLYYIVAGATLHRIEPDFDPRFRFMSEYVWGTHGWLMVTTFFALGLAAFTVALMLRDVHAGDRNGSGRIGFGLLTVGAVFVCLAGIFKEFLPHIVASAVALPSFVMGVLVYSWGFRAAPEWKSVYPPAILAAIGMLVLFTSILAGVAMPGLAQRAFLFLLLVWFAMAARRARRVSK